MVVVGLGEGHGDAKGDAWQDPPPRVFWGSPSIASGVGTAFGGDRVALCRVFSGLDGAEGEVEEEEVEESEQGAGGAGGSSEARDTLNLPSLISPVGAGGGAGDGQARVSSSKEKGIGCATPVFEGVCACVLMGTVSGLKARLNCASRSSKGCCDDTLDTGVLDGVV